MTDPRFPQPMTAQQLAAFGQALLTREALVELAVLAACLALAWFVARALQARARPDGHSVLFGHAADDGAAAASPAGRAGAGVLFPLLAFGLALAARWVLPADRPMPVLRIAVPLLLALVLVRLVARVLVAAFPRSPSVRRVARWIAWVVWVGLILWITGVLPVMAAWLESVSWTIGTARLSLLTVVQGAFNVVVVLVLALWLSAAVEARLLRGPEHSLSVRKIAANALRALLLFVGLMVALSSAGIDLTAFSVLGGALGVGLGFGLQKLASNYVSGFVILAERSLRIGDVVKVDNFEGRITDINTRATIIRAPNGRQSIVPNEMLIIQRVENAAHAETSEGASSVLCVPFGTDVPALRPRLLAALSAVERVMQSSGHAPAVHLSNFRQDGLELTVAYTVADPGNGMASVASEVNLAVLRVLAEAGVSLALQRRADRPDTDSAP